MGLVEELTELAGGVDVRVARGIEPVAEALGGLVGHGIGQRLGVDDVEAGTAQRAAHMLGETRPGVAIRMSRVTAKRGW